MRIKVLEAIPGTTFCYCGLFKSCGDYMRQVSGFTRQLMISEFRIENKTLAGSDRLTLIDLFPPYKLKEFMTPRNTKGLKKSV